MVGQAQGQGHNFTLVAPATVRMAVYDVTGRLVRSLVNEDLPAGVHAGKGDQRRTPLFSQLVDGMSPAPRATR
ncbi:MAG: hypothetical protein OEX18_10245 [Candidatus Krumholzibacteria bacterium]|nr:hypothetical protein [Candidatus Krumholzibacteria bacterium]